MITMRQLVAAELEASPELHFLLAEKLLNITSLARRLQPIIEKRLGEKVGTETISMAIRRIQQKRGSSPQKTMHKPNARNIQVQLDVAIFTYAKGAPIHRLVDAKAYRFFSFVDGRYEAMLAISQEDATPFKQAAVKIQTNMAAITITLENETADTVGAYAYIQATLALAGVSVAEILSLHDDLTLLIRDEHVDRAFQTLRSTLHATKDSKL